MKKNADEKPKVDDVVEPAPKKKRGRKPKAGAPAPLQAEVAS